MFIQGNPVLYLASKAGKESFGIGGVVINDSGIFPSPVGIRQRLRQVPVEDSHHGFDVVLKAFINQALIEGKPFSLGVPVPFGKILAQEMEKR